MAYIPRSSFGQAPGVIPMQVKKKHTIRIVSLTGTILMLCAVLATIGAFFYKNYLDKQLMNVQTELNNLNDPENEKKVHEIQMYDRKLSVAFSLLNNHIAPSRVFAEIEDITKQTVQFQTFEYLYDPGFEAEITLGGDTRELASVALQKMEVLKDDIFSNFIVSNITTVKTSDVLNSENGTPAENGTDGVKESLGVQFEIVGIFEKSSIEYSARPDTQQTATFSTPEIISTEASTTLDEITPETVMSNDETL